MRAELDKVFSDIEVERERQEALCADARDGGLDWTSCADPRSTDEVRLAVLSEEFGEVAKEINEARAVGTGSPCTSTELRSELIQLAAVACAWAEWLTA